MLLIYMYVCMYDDPLGIEQPITSLEKTYSVFT